MARFRARSLYFAFRARFGAVSLSVPTLWLVFRARSLYFAFRARFRAVSCLYLRCGSFFALVRFTLCFRLVSGHLLSVRVLSVVVRARPLYFAFRARFGAVSCLYLRCGSFSRSLHFAFRARFGAVSYLYLRCGSFSALRSLYFAFLRSVLSFQFVREDRTAPVDGHLFAPSLEAPTPHRGPGAVARGAAQAHG